jgi:hypothetical protein
MSTPVQSLFEVGRGFVNFRARADIPDFSLDQHGRMDRFQGFHGLLGLTDIFFEGQG